MRHNMHVALCSIIALLSGCATVPTKQFALEITSEPSGAEIWTHYRPKQQIWYGPAGGSLSVGAFKSSPMLVGKTPYRAELQCYRGYKPPWNNMNGINGGAAYQLPPNWWLTSTNALAPALFAVSMKFVDYFLFSRSASTLELDFTLRAVGFQDIRVKDSVARGSSIGILGFGGGDPRSSKRAEENVPPVVHLAYVMEKEGKPLAPQTGSPSAQQSATPTVPVQATAKSLTNSDVETMLTGGLPESTIIISVKRRPALFDTSPSALIELKNHGATAAILDAMMQP
jgi:hypothetical protein